MITNKESISTTLNNINETGLEKMVAKFSKKFSIYKIMLNAKILAGVPVDEINHIPLVPGSGMKENEVLIILN